MKKMFLVVDVFFYWSTSIVKDLQLTKWAVFSLRIIWGIFFWWKTILRELRILNCLVFCLRFSKAMTLNCSSFVYYSWKSLFLHNILKGLRDRPVLQNADLWHNITIPPFWEGNLSINMLTWNSLQKRTSFLRTTPIGCFLQESTCVGVSF